MRASVVVVLAAFLSFTSAPALAQSVEVDQCTALEGLTGLPCQEAAEAFGVDLANPIVDDTVGQITSLLVPSTVTHITDALNDEGSNDEVVKGTLDLGGGGGSTGATRSGHKYVTDVACDADAQLGYIRGVSIILKPSSSVSATYGFRIIERLTQATPYSGNKLSWVAHRLVDLSDPPGGVLRGWDPSSIEDYSGSTTLNLGVGYGGFSSSMSWSISSARAGGQQGQNGDHFAMYKHAGTTLTKSVKSESLWRYQKPNPRKSWYLPCGAQFFEP